MAETPRAPIRARFRRPTGLACRRSVFRAALLSLCAVALATVSSDRAAARQDWTAIAPAGGTPCAFVDGGRVTGGLRSALIRSDVAGESCGVDEEGLEARDTLDAAFLFFYRPRHGMQAAFEQGYRRHLDWHRERADSLPWLAWTVVAGRDPGTFVDGAFGIAFSAFDERVDPRGDAADAEVNVTAFADPISREVYRLRRDLGSATPLESRRPGPMQEVVWLTLKPGSGEAFEKAVRGVAGSGVGSYTIYERVLGGALPAYLLVVQLSSWADLADAQQSASGAVLRVAGQWLARADSEVWLYRPDLTYLPEAARAPDRPSSR